MSLIYGFTIIGLILLLGMVLTKMNWKVDHSWVKVEGIVREHGEVRRIAQQLEQHNIPTKIELERKSPSFRLLYKQPINAALKVKKADHERALAYLQKYAKSSDFENNK